MERTRRDTVHHWICSVVASSLFSFSLMAFSERSSVAGSGLVLDPENLISCENLFTTLSDHEAPVAEQTTQVYDLFERLFHKSQHKLDPLSVYLFGGRKAGEWLWKRYHDAGFKLNPLQTSVSVGHFTILFYKAYDSYFKHVKLAPEVRLTLLKALYRQEYEARKNRYTFFHAQKSSYYVPQLVFTWLLECYYDQAIDKDQWWALRFKKPGTNLPYLDGVKVMLEGPETDDRGDVISYKHFMNGPLFGNNYQQIGSSTIDWFTRNTNVGVKRVQRTIADLFNVFGWDVYYQKYKAEFDAVEAAMDSKKQDCGTLLLHSFDEDALRSFVYVAKAYGWKDALTIQGREVDDIKQICDTMRMNPELFDDWEHLDMHEYVFIQTEDHPTDASRLGSLNPFNSGIRTYHFTVEDMSDIKQMLADIFAKIKRDMQLTAA